MYNILDFGAKPDGVTNSTAAVQKAIDACKNAGGGRIIVPAGKYVIASLILCSNLHFEFEAGAFFLGSKNPDDFNPREKIVYPLYQDPTHSYFHRSMFFAEGCSNISFTGFGTVDMQSVWENTPVEGASKWCEKRAAKIFAFKRCTDITLSDLKLLHCTDVAVYFAGCERVKATRLTIDTNIDAISPDCCKDVLISDCFIRSGDDAIVLKSSYVLNEKIVCENVTVTNCTVSSRCNGIKLGTETNGGYRNIAISNCCVYNTYMAGVALEITDGGDLDGVLVNNITMKNVGTPLYVILSDRRRGPEGTALGTLKNVVISNINAVGPYDEPWLAPQLTAMWEGEQMCVTEVITSSITGHKDRKIENITLSDINICVPGGGKEEDRNIVLPENERNYPENNCFGSVLPASGIYFRHVKNLSLSNINISTYSEDKRDGLVLEDIENLEAVNI